MKLFDLFKREPVKPPADPPQYDWPNRPTVEELILRQEEANNAYNDYLSQAQSYGLGQYDQPGYQNALRNGMIGTYTGTSISGGLGNVATPESKIKDKVKKALGELDVYYMMPVTAGYGNSGVPDILACVEGRFFGIECKAGGNKPTALQEKHLKDITNAGGASLVIDETNVDNVTALILAKLGELK